MTNEASSLDMSKLRLDKAETHRARISVGASELCRVWPKLCLRFLELVPSVNTQKIARTCADFQLLLEMLMKLVSHSHSQWLEWISLCSLETGHVSPHLASLAPRCICWGSVGA